MTRRPLLFLVSVAFSALVLADEVADTAGNYFDDFPVVLSASRLVQPAQEAPAAVTVIDRDMIRASGARQIAELFRLVPGFLVSYRNGHAPIVTYHGLADPYARRLQVMIDGVSIYSPSYGGVDWYDLPIAIDDVERIEVVRGPNGASFGANAFVGMVNIITREPAAGDPSDIAVTSGDNGINDWSARYAGGRDNWSYRLSAGQRSDDGFDNQADSSRVEHFNFRGRYRIDGINELTGTFLHSNGVGTEYYSYVRPRTFNDNSVQIRWTRAIGADEFWVQIHHGERYVRERYVQPLDLTILHLGVYPFEVNLDNDARRDEIEFQQSFGGNASWRLLWGGQWRQDGARSPTAFGRPDWLDNRLERIFASSEWRPHSAILLQGGATYENSTLTGSSISPRLSATAFLTEHHSIRIGASKARRMPTPFEDAADERFMVPSSVHSALSAMAPFLTAPWNTIVLEPVLFQSFASSGGLRDEKILGREIAYQGRFPALHLTTEIRWFNDQVENLIYPYRIDVPTLLLLISRVREGPDYASSSYDFRNLDSARIRGAEGSLRWSPWAGADLWLTAARTTIDSSNIDVNNSATSPTHSGSVLLSQQFPWDTALSLAYYRVGEMQWLGGGDPMPRYERIDVRLGKRFRWGQHTAELSWTTQNVMNSNYPDFESARRNKRISWAKFQYTF